MKDELHNVKMGSGSTVCREASTGIGIGTFARPPPLTPRWSENFVLWVTDSEVEKLVSDLERIVPQQAPKWVDWDQTRKDPGTWPTKMVVSMWFKNEANLVTMIDLLRTI